MKTPQTARSVRAFSIGLVALSAACHRSSSSGFAEPVVTNLDLAASELFGDEDLWLIVGQEAAAGGADLNSDGDADDDVVFLLDSATGVFLNTFLALGRGAALLPIQAVDGSLAVFAVSEAGQGNTDLNGDGDANDLVLHACDGVLGVRNLELAVPTGAALPSDPRPVAEGVLAAFTVTELGQGGQDLNGDGDSSDSVLFLYDRLTRSTRNAGIVPASGLWIGGGGVAYYAQESASSTDLNADGDEDDFVLQIYDWQSEVNRNSGLASFMAQPLFAAGTWVVPVVEFAQGSSDLNGDGDGDDAVFFAVHAPTAALDIGLSNLGLTSTVESSRAGSGRFVLVADELAGVNDNGDGDLTDSIPVVYDPVSDRLTSTRTAIMPSPSRPVFFGADLAAFQANEFDQGIDLDGNGDPFGSVVQVIDLTTGTTTNLALDSFRIAGAEDLLLILRLEGPAEMDWNGDGDRFDAVLHIWDPPSPFLVGPEPVETKNTGIACVEVFGGTDERLLFYSQELFEGRDLNEDGDLEDAVFVLHDVQRGRPSSLGLAGGYGEIAALAANGRAIFLATEESQEQDLNGDGDLVDQVLHISETLNMAATAGRVR